MTSDANVKSDVVVVGGGLAGLASAIHLARAGVTVTSLEPVEQFEQIVGESLDWSAPEFFEELGFEMKDLVQAGIATYKRHVTLQLADGSHAEYIPSDWLGRPPFNIELRTLHLDRVSLHQELRRVAEQSGVSFIHETAAIIERTGKRVESFLTDSGTRYTARWFIDASGSASTFLGRQLDLPYTQYGPRKVGMWSYASVEDWQEGTILYSENRKDEYFSWIWEIPIAPGKVSLGYVTTGAAIKHQRARGQSVDDIFRLQLSKFARFDRVLSEGNLSTPAVRSFQCRDCLTACGPNWVIVGEAAAVADPITGNGVTAALRHAAEGSRLILRFLKRKRIPWYARAMYNLRVSQTAKFFNSLIEKLAYNCTLRNRFGLLKTGDIYTALAWSLNHLYSRIRPDGIFKTAAFVTALSTFRAIAWLMERIVELFPARGPRLVLREVD